MSARGGARRGRAPVDAAGSAARRLAVDALIRIDRDGAYANIVLPKMLASSELEPRDRGFVTELVYGTTRMRRSCDWLVDRFIPDPERIDVTARNWLRLGAFQLAFLDTPPHAAVGATVGAAPKKIAGLCNAVLRRVAESLPATYPTDAIALGYPDWIVDRLSADLGHDRAVEALTTMDRPATVSTRDDGYVQDEGSQLVVDAVDAQPGERILDLCAAPGGKATALVSAGARVVASDLRPSRVGLIASNRERLGIEPSALGIVTADGRTPPFAAASFDRVLLDAPCSGLGSLRRRPDARWRIEESSIATLAELQLELLESALDLVRPGGVIIYSVCTITAAETIGIDDAIAARHPELVALDPPSAPWEPLGRGALLLPQVADTDGMYLLRLRTPEPGDASVGEADSSR